MPILYSPAMRGAIPIGDPGYLQGYMQQMEREREWAFKAAQLRQQGQIAGAKFGEDQYQFDQRQQQHVDDQEYQSQKLEEQTRLRAKLNEEELNQAEKIRMDKLKASSSYVDQQVLAGAYSREEADDLKMQIMTNLDPLRQRQARAQIRKIEQQEKQAEEQAKKIELQTQQAAEFRAKTMEGRIATAKHPKTGEDIQFYESAPGKWEPVPWTLQRGPKEQKPVDMLALHKQAVAAVNAMNRGRLEPLSPEVFEEKVDAYVEKLKAQAGGGSTGGQSAAPGSSPPSQPSAGGAIGGFAGVGAAAAGGQPISADDLPRKPQPHKINEKDPDPLDKLKLDAFDAVDQEISATAEKAGGLNNQKAGRFAQEARAALHDMRQLILKWGHVEAMPNEGEASVRKQYQWAEWHLKTALERMKER